MYTLYSMQRSGNCYKVRLALAQLDIAHKLVDMDILKGETRTPDFLAKNPNGQIPLLEIEPGRFLAESNAILWFLAQASDLVGHTELDRARVLQWMFFEQLAIVPSIGAAYFWLCLIKGGRELQQHALDDWMEEGSRSLNVLDKHVAKHRFFAGERYSIADVALYSYIAHAPDGGVALTPHVHIGEWLKRIEALPYFAPMPATKAGLLAA